MKKKTKIVVHEVTRDVFALWKLIVQLVNDELVLVEITDIDNFLL